MPQPGAILTCLSARCGQRRRPTWAPLSCLNTALQRGALTRRFSAMERRGLTGSRGTLARSVVGHFQFKPRLALTSGCIIHNLVARLQRDERTNPCNASLRRFVTATLRQAGGVRYSMT